MPSVPTTNKPELSFQDVSLAREKIPCAKGVDFANTLRRPGVCSVPSCCAGVPDDVL